MPELPLRAGQLKPVTLERGLARARPTAAADPSLAADEQARAGLEALAHDYREILKNVRGAGVMLGFLSHLVLDELCARVGTVELAGPVVWTRSNKHTGVRHMPITLTTRRA